MSNTEEHATMTTCKICNDTHTMTLRDRDVMCTHCPVPCDACRAGGKGAFCATTPCSCVCHGGAAAESVEPAYGGDDHINPAVSWELIRNEPRSTTP